MKIKILNYKEFSGMSKSLKGTFSFEMVITEQSTLTPYQITISGCKYWEKDGKSQFITLPEKSLKDNISGKWTKEFDYVQVLADSKDIKSQIATSVKEYLDKNQVKDVPSFENKDTDLF